jgi:DNA-binding CsgD family transcriptional regulator
MRDALARTGLPRLFYDGVVSAETLEAAAEARARPRGADTRLDRRLFALMGADLVVRARDREQAVALALRALGDGALLEEETSEGMGFYLASAVLYWSDAYAEDLVFLDAAVDDARRRGSVLGFATASYTRGMVYERQGRLHAAATEYQAALDLREQGWADFADAAVAGAARVNLALGRRDEALTLEPALRRGAARGRFIGAPTATVAGMIRASQGDHERALEDYRQAGRLLGEHPDNGSIAEWRELTASSLHALGLHEEALAAAEEAVRHARRWGAPRALGVALLALADVTPGGADPAVLRQAVTTLETAGSLDLLARARLQLAARLTRDASTREEAFALMTEALDYGRSHAVPPVTGQATTMLLRAGHPVDDADVQPVARLTPGERRVAELAAAGDTNRQIAEKLFVTVKAVEWHLSNTYRKLEISSRSELAVSLYGDPGPSSSSLR